MNKLAWAGIGYAVWLGVKNWHQIQTLEVSHKALVDAVNDHQALFETYFERGR